MQFNIRQVADSSSSLAFAHFGVIYILNLNRRVTEGLFITLEMIESQLSGK